METVARAETAMEETASLCYFSGGVCTRWYLMSYLYFTKGVVSNHFSGFGHNVFEKV